MQAEVLIPSFGNSLRLIGLHTYLLTQKQRTIRYEAEPEFDTLGGCIMEEKQTKKCYNCRKEHKNKGIIFCDDCKEKQEKGELDTKGSSTYVIYDKI